MGAVFYFERMIKMTIKNISVNDLRKMNNKEGLILQGCGGEIQEWVDGINNILTENGILLDDTKFENVSVFQNDGVTCILYPFEDVHLNVGKLAMWRLQSYTAFAGTWLSDYVDNKLGGFEPIQSDDIDEGQVMGL
jgi:3-dehydroquinate dehydratase